MITILQVDPAGLGFDVSYGFSNAVTARVSLAMPDSAVEAGPGQRRRQCQGFEPAASGSGNLMAGYLRWSRLRGSSQSRV